MKCLVKGISYSRPEHGLRCQQGVKPPLKLKTIYNHVSILPVELEYIGIPSLSNKTISHNLLGNSREGRRNINSSIISQ